MVKPENDIKISGRPAHRPSKYKSKYAQMMIDFFSVPPWEWVEETKINSKGHEVVNRRKETNRLPTFAWFCRENGIAKRNFFNWIKKNEPFGRAHAKCKELQEEFIAENTLQGLWNSNFSIFLAKNITSWRDVKEHKVDGGVKHQHFYDEIIKRSSEMVEDQTKVIDVTPEKDGSTNRID